MDIDSEVGEGFNDFDVVTGNWHKVVLAHI